MRWVNRRLNRGRDLFSTTSTTRAFNSRMPTGNLQDTTPSRWFAHVRGADSASTNLMTIDKNQIEANLRLHVDRLAGLIGARTLRRPKTIQATIGYIEGQWTEMGYQNTRETYDALGDEATNLIVEQTGSKRPEEIVLLGAHYDTVSTTPGADDNEIHVLTDGL